MKTSLLRECVRIAIDKEDSFDERFKHFSFIVQRNKILEWATNRAAAPLVNRGFPTYGKLHAETESYRRASGLLQADYAFECVNIRVKNGFLKLSAPCNCCYNFLRTEGCNAIWFSTDNGFARI